MAIEISEANDRISDFLTKHNVGVLATSDAFGKTHAATVYVSFDSELNFYFVTKKETQKSRNLQVNPHAAIAIFDADTQATVQVQGIVKQIVDERAMERVFTDIWSAALRTSQSHVPPTSRLIAGDYIVYMLSSTSVRMATFSKPDPADYDNIFETVNTQPSFN